MTVNRKTFVDFLENSRVAMQKAMIDAGAQKTLPLSICANLLHDIVAKSGFAKWMLNEKEIEIALFENKLLVSRVRAKELASLLQSTWLVSKGYADDLVTNIYATFRDEFVEYTTIAVFRKPGQDVYAFYEFEYVKNVQEKDIPYFKEFLSRCDDPTLLVNWIGSLLEPESSREQYMRLQGSGGDGKTTLIEALQMYFNKAVAVTDSKSIFDQFNGNVLEGKRLVLFTDENNTSFTSSGLMKRLTGDSTIAIEEKFMPKRNIQINCKILISANKNIVLTDCEADRRRFLEVRVIKTIPEHMRQREDGKKFVAEGIKIVSYCYDRYCEFLQTTGKSVGSSLIMDKSRYEEVMMLAYEDPLDTFHANFEITNDPNDKVKVLDARKIIFGFDGFRKTMKTTDLIEGMDAQLRKLGVYVVAPSNVKYYANIKRKSV